MYLVTASEMQVLDRRTIESFGLPGRILMENAGRGAAAFLFELYPDIAARRVGVIAGRGNNGGDGYVIARCLSQRDVDVTVFLLSERTRVVGDAASNLELLSPLGVPVVEIPNLEAFDAVRTSMRDRDLWVDAILGTGLRSEVQRLFQGGDRFHQQPRPTGLRGRCSLGFECGYRSTLRQLHPGACHGHLWLCENRPFPISRDRAER